MSCLYRSHIYIYILSGNSDINYIVFQEEKKTQYGVG